MSVIQIDTGEVQSTGGKFIKMQSEVEGLINQARSMMSNLESQFRGIRARKIFGEWNDMQRSLDAASETLKKAGDLLGRAATDFSEVDQR